MPDATTEAPAPAEVADGADVEIIDAEIVDYSPDLELAAVDAEDEVGDADAVERERDQLQDFVKGLTHEDMIQLFGGQLVRPGLRSCSSAPLIPEVGMRRASCHDCSAMRYPCPGAGVTERPYRPMCAFARVYRSLGESVEKIPT